MMDEKELQEIDDYCRKLDDLNGSAGPEKLEVSLLACIGMLLVELIRSQPKPAKSK